MQCTLNVHTDTNTPPSLDLTRQPAICQERSLARGAICIFIHTLAHVHRTQSSLVGFLSLRLPFNACDVVVPARALVACNMLAYGWNKNMPV